MLVKIYLIGGILLLGLYSVVALTGKEFGDAQRQIIPASVRQSPGGYRSFHFWYVGYRGGK